VIVPLEFLASARDVLPMEDTDFTDWLSDQLDYLEQLLGLDSLELVERESPVGSFFSTSGRPG
jgi:hypothetical protein